MSGRESSRGKQRKKEIDAAEKVVVAVKASKEIPKTALVWALTHVVQPGGCITLLVVIPSESTGFQFPLILLDDKFEQLFDACSISALVWT